MINFRGDFIKSLAEKGEKVYALAPDFDEQSCNQIRQLGAEPIAYTLSRVGLNPFKDLTDLLRLLLIFRRLKPDICLAYTVKPIVYGLSAAWLCGVSRRIAMIEGLGYVFTESDMSRKLHRRLMRWLVSYLYAVVLKAAHTTIFLNKDDLNEFVNRHLVLPNKCIVLGGIGVDLEKWKMTPPVIEPVIFLMAARLLKEKGVYDFIEAARIVNANSVNAKFILLGGVDSNPGAIDKDEVEKWAGDGIVEWPGHVPVPTWMALASVFVLPSYREGVPRSTQEAMAMGRPVITTDVPGCRETVVDGVNGFLIPPKSAEKLADRMLWFIANKDQIPAMGIQSRKIAESHFDVHNVNQRLTSILFNEDC